jgi:co-chaperonin GroES (HSP10)
MTSAFCAKHVKIKALHDWVIVSDMDFGDITTASGLVIRSDNGKTHGIKPRWGKVYCVGPKQQDVAVGDWILIEHGRWTRAMHINDGERELKVHRVDANCIIGVSDSAPTADDWYVADSM